MDEDDVMVWTSHNPDMTLFFNQHKIAGTPDRYSVQSGNNGYTLVISDAQPGDSGEFECEVLGWEAKSMTLSVTGWYQDDSHERWVLEKQNGYVYK